MFLGVKIIKKVFLVLFFNPVFAICNFSQIPNFQLNCPSSQDTCYSSSTLNLNCDNNEYINASLSTGISGNYSTRLLKSDTHQINYNVYLDPNQQKIFGDGTSGTYKISSTCNGICSFNLYLYSFSQSLPIYAGNYSDNLIITISY